MIRANHEVQTTRESEDPCADLAYAVIEQARRDAMEEYANATTGHNSNGATAVARRSGVAFFENRNYDGWAAIAHIGGITMDRARTAVLEQRKDLQ